MRLAITLGRKTGSTAFEIITGPEVPLADQLRAVKAGAPEGFDEVEVWSRDGGCIRKVFAPGVSKINKLAMLPIKEQRALANPEIPAPAEDSSPADESEPDADADLAAQASGADIADTQPVKSKKKNA